MQPKYIVNQISERNSNTVQLFEGMWAHAHP